MADEQNDENTIPEGQVRRMLFGDDDVPHHPTCHELWLRQSQEARERNPCCLHGCWLNVQDPDERIVAEHLVGMRPANDADHITKRQARFAMYRYAQRVAGTARGHHNREPVPMCVYLLVQALGGQSEVGFQAAH